jgi:hypothetical protein
MITIKAPDHDNRSARGIFRSGILYVWNRPIIIIGLLIIPAVFLFNLIIRESFTSYTNCNYLIVTQLEMDPFFCNGYEVKVLNTTLFTIPGLKDVIDPPLELARSAIALGVIVLFAFISLCVTILIVNWKSVVRFVTFNKEEWKKFMASTRIWLIFFVGLCLVFYFAVINNDFFR